MPKCAPEEGEGRGQGRTVNSCTFYENEICKEVVVYIADGGHSLRKTARV